MSPGNLVQTLRHGTTRQRADSIVQNGPSANFKEPGGLDVAGGFSTCLPTGPFPVGTPENYAAAKGRLFPNEGGPAIVEVEVPDDIAALGINAGGEIRFEPGYGLDELRQAWHSLARRVV